MEFLSSKDTFDCTLFNLGFLMLYKGNFSSERERDRERQRETKRQTERDRETETETERQTERLLINCHFAFLLFTEMPPESS